MPKLRVIANKLSLRLVIFFSFNLQADSFENNIYNNHGIVGLINMPTARFYNEGVHGVTIYNSDPVQKMTLTSNPYDWLEASFFYMNLPKERICRPCSFNWSIGSRY